MNALTDKRGALYPLTQSQKRTAAAIPTFTSLGCHASLYALLSIPFETNRL
jgi:hypothetical protein